MLALPALAARAEDTAAELLLPKDIPRPGESFTATLSLSGNPGISALGLTLAYDSAVVECADIELGDVLTGMMTAQNPTAPDGARVSAASAENLSRNGVVASFTFRVLSEGEPGLEVTRFALGNTAGERIACDVRTARGEESAPAPSPDDPAPAPEESPDPGDYEPGSEPVRFTDTEGHWGEEILQKAAAQKLFEGYPDGSFQPDRPLTRGEFVTLLWRMAGSPESAGAAPFTDVAEDAWYAKPVAWAREQGLVDGVSETEFAPDAPLQRQAAMKILFAYSGGVPGMEAMLTGVYDSAFADSGEIAAWGKQGLYWAYYNGLITGVGGDRLDPAGAATRAQMAKILVNYLDRFAQ